MQNCRQVIAGRQATSSERAGASAEPEPERITCQLKTPSVNPPFPLMPAMIAHWNVGQIIAWQLQHPLNSHCHGLHSLSLSLFVRFAARFLDINPDAAAEKQFSTGMLNISLGTWADNDTRKHNFNTATILSISLVVPPSLPAPPLRQASARPDSARRLSQKPRATTCTLCEAGRGTSSMHCENTEIKNMLIRFLIFIIHFLLSIKYQNNYNFNLPYTLHI